MPRGIYPRRRTPAQLVMWEKNFTKGRTKDVQARGAEKRRKLAQTQEWRDKVSQGTKEAMHRPDVREKHLKGLKRAIATHGVNFKGGQHQETLEFIIPLIPQLISMGFQHEHKIKTKGHGTEIKTRGYLLVDFGHEETKTAIEIDGPSHRSQRGKQRDYRKQTVLTALGWEIIRFSNEQVISTPNSVVSEILARLTNKLGSG